jgi:gliding motility-associated-like protein
MTSAADKKSIFADLMHRRVFQQLFGMFVYVTYSAGSWVVVCPLSNLFRRCLFAFPLFLYACLGVAQTPPAGVVTLQPLPGEPVLVEGCAPIVLEFAVEPVVATPLLLRFLLNGTAQNGEDIGFVPPSLQIPPGTALFRFPIRAIDDGIAEPRESLRLLVSMEGVWDTLDLMVVDPLLPRPELGEDQTLCPGEPLLLRDVSGDTTLRYEWLLEERVLCGDCDTLEVRALGEYVVRATNRYGCVGGDTLRVSAGAAVAEPTGGWCVGQTATRVGLAWDPVPEALFYEVRRAGEVWETTQQPYFETGGLQPDTSVVFELRAVGVCGVSTVDTLGCRTLDCAVPPYILKVSPTSCHGASDGSIRLELEDSLQLVSFWLGDKRSETGLFTGLSGGRYTIEMVTQSGCTASLGVLVPSPEPVVARVRLEKPAFCVGSSDGAAVLELVQGAVDSVVWDNGEKGFRATRLQAGMRELVLYVAGACEPLRDTIEVPFEGSLALLSEVYPIACSGDADGEIAVLAYGGKGPYRYSWSEGSTGPVLKNLPAGSYGLEVRDAQGCLLRDTLRVTDPRPLELALELENVSCFGSRDGSAKVEVSGGNGAYTYFWSSGGLEPRVGNLSPGEYEVRVQDGLGCREDLVFEVGYPDSLDVGFSLTQPQCYGGSDGRIALQPSGGNGDYRIVWGDSAASGFERSDIPAGLYGYEVYDGKNCRLSGEIRLEEPPQLDFTWEVGAESCAGNRDGSIRLHIEGGTAPYDIRWEDGLPGEVRVGLPASDLVVEVRDTKACLAVARIVVPLKAVLEVNTSLEEPSCNGFTDGKIALRVRGGLPPYRYVWSDGSQSGRRSDLGAGQYDLTVYDSGVCQESASVKLTQPEPLELLSELLVPSCDYLSDGQVSVQVSGGVSPYRQKLGSREQLGSEVVFGELPGNTYPYLVTDDNGCRLSDTFYLPAPEPLTLRKQRSEPDCYDADNGSVAVQVEGGNGGYRIRWTDSRGQRFSGDAMETARRGTYWIEVADQKGCMLRDTLLLGAPPRLELDIQLDNPVEEYKTYTPEVSVAGGKGLYTYLWSWNDSLFYSCSDCLPPDLVPTIYEELKLEVFDENGCYAVDRERLAILDNNNFFVPNAFSPNGDGINDCFGPFGYPEIRMVSFEVFDRWGNQVYAAPPFEMSDSGTCWDGTLRGKNLPTGIYIWRLLAIFPDGYEATRQGSVLLVR